MSWQAEKWTKKWMALAAAMVVAGLVVSPVCGADDDEEDDEADIVSMNTIGAVSAAYLYQAHLTIGLLADAQAKGLYPKEKCSQLQEVNIQLLDITQKQFSDLVKKGDLDPADAKVVKEFGKLSGLLRKEAAAVDAYWKSGSDEDLQKYTQAREAAKKHIGKLFAKEK